MLLLLFSDFFFILGLWPVGKGQLASLASQELKLGVLKIKTNYNGSLRNYDGGVQVACVDNPIGLCIAVSKSH